MDNREKIDLLRSCLVQCITVFRVQDGFRNDNDKIYKELIIAIDNALIKTQHQLEESKE